MHHVCDTLLVHQHQGADQEGAGMWGALALMLLPCLGPWAGIIEFSPASVSPTVNWGKGGSEGVLDCARTQEERPEENKEKVSV